MRKFLTIPYLFLLTAPGAMPQTTEKPGEPISQLEPSQVSPPMPAAAQDDDRRPLTEKEVLDALNASMEGRSVTVFPKSLEEIGTSKPGDQTGGQSNGTTEITARLSVFSEKDHVVVFTRDVYVENPQFTVTCDKLTAYLHQNEARAEQREIASTAKAAARAAAEDPNHAPKAATPRPTPKTSPTPASKKRISDATSKNASQEERDAVASPPKILQKPTGGLEQAICEGSVVIVQDKIEDDGTVTRNVGHARKAIYYADSGDIYLFGSPDVEQGLNTCVATEDRTVMILNRDGHMTVNGLHRSLVKDSGASSAVGNDE